jgi:putative DNA primase/helicase
VNIPARTTSGKVPAGKTLDPELNRVLAQREQEATRGYKSLKTIGEKFEDFIGNHTCDRRWVSVKNKTPVRPGTDTPVEWRDIKNRWTWEEIQMIPGDFGIILDKTGLVCIDFDKCINDNEILPEVGEVLSKLDTWTEISQSGRGPHAWIITDANTKNQKPGGVFEIISDGHVRVTGNAFTPYASNPIQMVDGEKLGKILRLTSSGNGRSVNGQNPVILTREKIREGGRNDNLFKLASSLRAKGLSEPAIRAAIAEENKDLCDPPLSDDEISRIATSAGNYTPGATQNLKSDVKVQAPGDLYTQIRIADQFIEGYLDTWRYNVDRKQWFFWTGKVWEADESDQIKNVDKEFLKEYLALIPTMQIGKGVVELTKFIVSLNTSKGIRDILSIAAPGMTIRDQDLDKDPNLLNCQNGTLDLKTGILRPHDRNDYCSRIASTDYLPDADCPMWEAHIKTILEDNKELIDSVQELLGYSLFLGNPDAVFTVFFGSGRNGKSVTLEVISHLLSGYAVSVSPNTFMAEGDRAGSDRILMRGARLITASEPADSSKKRCELDTGFIKTASGNDPVSARRLYCEGTSFKVLGLVVLSTNALPKIHDQSVAIWDRLWCVPFNHYFMPEDRDKDIATTLITEGPGILNWLITGYKRYLAKTRLIPCAAITDQTTEYRRDEDFYTPFFDSGSVCIEKTARIQASRLYTIFETWFNHQYPDNKKPATPQKFGRDMSTRFRKKQEGGFWVYYGIGIPGQQNFTDGKHDGGGGL